MRLNGKVCAITGGGAGIGGAASRLFAQQGAHVIILELNESHGRDTQAAISAAGGNATYLHCNVADEQSVHSAFETIGTRFNRLDVLYNNASVFLSKEDGPVADLETEVWRKILSINLDSVFFCCRNGIPLMIRGGGGSVINTASSAALIGIPECDAYTATKGATLAMTRSMAVEYGPQKIRVNCIAPAAIDTAMLRESSIGNSNFDERAFFSKAPLSRYGTAEEIAQVALFLASDESSYLNGTVVVADGGITIRG